MRHAVYTVLNQQSSLTDVFDCVPDGRDSIPGSDGDLFIRHYVYTGCRARPASSHDTEVFDV